MIRRKGPILAAAVVAAFALGWYRGLFGIDATAPDPAPEAPKQADVEPDGVAPTAVLTPTTQASPGTAALPAQAPTGSAPGPDVPPTAAEPEARASAEPPPPSAPPAPGFDVVRVEPDGSTVVAGRGAANEAISLTDGTRTFAEARTDANGDFVMSLSLPAGSHRLQLAQRDDAVSNDAAVVNVPARGRPGELLVMMERPGEASEVLQRPAEQPAEPAAVAEAASAVPEPAEPQVAAVAPAAPAPMPAGTAADTPPTVAPPTDAGVAVEAVEIEGDRLFVAGSAKGRPTVRIYLDDAFVAESRSGDGDRFIASAKVDVPVGDHTIRADALDADGRVVGRVEVPFQRPAGPSMAAVAPAPNAEAQAASQGTAADVAPGQPAAPAGPAEAPPAPADLAAAPADPAPAFPESAADAPAPGAAGEPQVVRQAPLQAAASRVIIRRGDTLWRISRETYGRGSRYTVIYLANGDQIRNPDRIYPGQVFRMPSAAEAEAPPRG